MPETRVVEQVFRDGTLIEEITAVISDEQLAEEAETKVLAQVDTLIDQIDSLPKARVFLKRLCKRLVTKGLLP